MAVETRYAQTGDIHLAYQVVGKGALDLVLVPEFWHSIEAQWEEPGLARFLRRLASFGRLICFDQRGTGMSDPVALSELPSLEQWMDDVRAVMDAVDSKRAALISSGGGTLLSLPFAAHYPDRVSALVVLNGWARLVEAPDYPWGTTPGDEAQIIEQMRTRWGRGDFLLKQVAPSRVGDEAFRRWWGRYQRLGATPGSILVVRRALQQLDVRHVLPSIQAPALVITRRNDWVRPGNGRYIAEHLRDAKYVELPGPDYFVFFDEVAAEALDEIEAFLTGVRPVPEQNRVLATILFTDIVGSTSLAAELGDRRWAELLIAHHELVRRELERFRGKEIDTAGDGFLATFDGPARAVRCACAIREALDALGLQIRAGLHTGEVEMHDGRIRGLAVHVGERVTAAADAGEVLVSSTVKDLVAGAGIRFADRGTQALKGVPGEWRLFAVAD